MSNKVLLLQYNIIIVIDLIFYSLKCLPGPFCTNPSDRQIIVCCFMHLVYQMNYSLFRTIVHLDVLSVSYPHLYIEMHYHAQIHNSPDAHLYTHR